MASSPEIIEEGEEAAKAAAAAAARKKRKRILLGAAAGTVLLLGGGGGTFLLLSGDGARAEAAAEAGHGADGEKDAASKSAFVDVPPVIVNLRSPDGAARFLKLHFMLVPGPAGSVNVLKSKLPLVLDAYQPFLRELRPEDLAGSAAVFRIKEELLVRAGAVLGDGMVKDILIQDLVQQ